jgi:RNA polymerase sigma-70 factor, ECF subfamily
VEETVIAEARAVVSRRGRRAGLSAEDREDLAQDVLLKYLQAWPDGSAPANIGAWFETATGNAIVDRFRAEGRRPTDRLDDDPVRLAVAAMRSGRTTSDRALELQLLRRILGLIPADDARLLRNRYLDGHNSASIAARLGITVAAADQRTTRAKKRLREALEQRPDLVAELRSGHPRPY